MSSGEGKYNLYSPGSTGWSTLRNDEFHEEDVWGVYRETKQSHTSSNSKSDSIRESSCAVSRRLPSASRMIPKANSNSHTEQGKQLVRQSAPVNIPDWSKIYGTRNGNGNSSSKKASYDDEDHGGSSDGVMSNSWDNDQEDDDDDGLIPPHEWIARKMARSQISSFSVCEGVGRTLKGRDLSNVRNAVLTRTGFLE